MKSIYYNPTEILESLVFRNDLHHQRPINFCLVKRAENIVRTSQRLFTSKYPESRDRRAMDENDCSHPYNSSCGFYRSMKIDDTHFLMASMIKVQADFKSWSQSSLILYRKINQEDLVTIVQFKTK